MTQEIKFRHNDKMERDTVRLFNSYQEVLTHAKEEISKIHPLRLQINEILRKSVMCWEISPKTGAKSWTRKLRKDLKKDI
jgi:hypothetical protein